MGAIATTLGSIKGAIEAVQSLHAAVTEVKLLEVKAVLLKDLGNALGALIAANEAELDAADRIRALEAEILRLKDWSAEAEDYELADAGQGSLAYRRKDRDNAAEPSHWLCPNCFGERKKSLLQPEYSYGNSSRFLRCSRCPTVLTIAGYRSEAGKAR